MVYPDIGSASKAAKNKPFEFHLASVADRFLAFVLDSFLLAPVISLMVAGQLKEVRNYALQNENSPEAVIVWFMFVLSVILISIFLQAVFTFFWSATPGQRLLNLRVVSLSYSSYENNFNSLSFMQCLFRSFLWWFSFLFIGWPFLEILSHPQRRCLHDRASDTMVISAVPTGDLGPSPMEFRFISSWMRLIFLSLLLMLGLYSIKVHQMVRGGFFSREEYDSKGYLCELPVSNALSASKRLDILLALRLLDKKEDECIDSETDLALWNREELDKPMGYLVKYFLEKDNEKKDEYSDFICEKYPEHEACEVVKFDSGESTGVTGLKKKGMTLFTSRVLVLEDMMKQKNYVTAGALIQDLLKEKSLEPALEKVYINLGWQVQAALRQQPSRKGRVPASAELEELLQDFKKRFEIE
jgi:uncharacterized RDD family membrane protein YckC